MPADHFARPTRGPGTAIRSDAGHNATFLTHRTQLLGVAQRIVQSRADAEDIVQDAWLRWSATAPAEIEDPKAWLITVVTRLAIDCLRKRKSNTHVSIEHGDTERAGGLLSDEPLPDNYQDLRWATYCLHELLNPTERAALILRDVFEVDYPTVARMINKQVPACRQIVHRARGRLGQSVRTISMPQRVDLKLMAFTMALAAADLPILLRLMLGDS